MVFRIIDQNDGTTKVPISTSADASSNTVVNHVDGFLVGGVATPVSAAAPLPVAVSFPTTQAVTWTGQTVALSFGSAAIGSVTVSGSVATTAAALPLPSGAATAAKQPAPGTAGTPSADVLSIQGVSGGAPLPVVMTAAASIATGQVSVGSAATLIVASRSGRRKVTIVQEGATLVRLGGSAVTLATGVPLPGAQYASFDIDGAAAIYGIAASGSQTVSFVEVF